MTTDNALENATYASAARRSTLHVLGDSISANGLIVGSSSGFAVASAVNPWFWAHMLSGARLRIGTIAATGGYTTQQIKDTHLPTILALVQPGERVAVLAGTNDGWDGAAGDAATRANMASMWAQIAAKGAVPVLCTVPPVDADTGAALGWRVTYNAWVARQARANGWPFLDFFGALSDPATAGDYKAGFGVDGIHPAGAGAKVMGQLVADKLTPTDAPEPFFATFNNGTGVAPSDGALMLGNACMGTVTTPGNPPDQFPSFTAATGGSTYTTPTVAGVAGKMFTTTRGAAGSDIWGAQTTSQVAVPGHRYYIAFKIAATFPGAGKVFAKVTNDSDSLTVVGIDGQAWDVPIPAGCAFATEVVWPNNANNSIRMHLGALYGACDLSIGQLTIMDLTAIGADT